MDVEQNRRSFIFTIFIFFILFNHLCAELNIIDKPNSEQINTENEQVNEDEEILKQQVEVFKQKTLEKLSQFQFTLNLSSPTTEEDQKQEEEFDATQEIPIFFSLDISSPLEKLNRYLDSFDWIIVFVTTEWCDDCKNKIDTIKSIIGQNDKILKVINNRSVQFFEVSYLEINDKFEVPIFGLSVEVGDFRIFKGNHKINNENYQSSSSSPIVSIKFNQQFRPSYTSESVLDYLMKADRYYSSILRIPIFLSDYNSYFHFLTQSSTSIITLLDSSLNGKEEMIDICNQLMKKNDYNPRSLQCAFISDSTLLSLIENEVNDWNAPKIIIHSLTHGNHSINIHYPLLLYSSKSQLLESTAKNGKPSHLISNLQNMNNNENSMIGNCLLILPSFEFNDNDNDNDGDANLDSYFQVFRDFHYIASVYNSYKLSFYYFTSYQSGLMEKLQIKNLPSLVIIDKSGAIFIQNNDLSKSKMEEFLMKYVIRTQKQYLRSVDSTSYADDQQNKNHYPSIMNNVLYRDISAQFIVDFLSLKSPSNLLIFFHSPSCGFCKSVQFLIINEVEKRIREIGITKSSFEIVRFNTFLNDPPPFLHFKKNVDSILSPQIVLIPMNSQEIYTFTSTISLSNVISFISQKSTLNLNQLLSQK